MIMDDLRLRTRTSTPQAGTILYGSDAELRIISRTSIDDFEAKGFDWSGGTLNRRLTCSPAQSRSEPRNKNRSVPHLYVSQRRG